MRVLACGLRFISSVACLMALAFLAIPGGLHAQADTHGSGSGAKDLTGTWQGTLHAGRDLRTVIKISKDDKGGYEAVFYSIDQGGRPLPADSVTLDGSVVKMALKMIGGSFEGKLSGDGNTIDGSWSQGPNPLPLVLTRATPETAWTIPPPPPVIPPMAKDANPSFEVATIKPSNSGATRMQALIIRGRNFITRASSLEDLIAFAYQVQAKEIVNGPAWMDTERYDIDAIPDAEGVPDTAQIRTMIQKLLADRFKMTFHHEQRSLPAYVLTVGKNGQKLTSTEMKGNLPGLGFRPANGGITLMVRNATMPDFTGFLQVLVLDRPVVDQTGLTGHYDFQCTFAPDDSEFGGHPPHFPAPGEANAAPGSTADAASAPSLFEAVQDQLGLKLIAQKADVQVIAIDHIEHPSPN